MYVVYFRAYIIFACTCNIEPRRAFVPCNLRNLYSMFFDQNLYSCFFAVPFALSLLPFVRSLHSCVPFCRTFGLKLLQGSFYAVFRAVLSDPNFRRVLLYLLHRSSLSHGSKHGKNAVIRGRGGPLGRGARGATDSPHNFLFFVPKNFFSGKFPLSSRFMPHFNAKIPFPLNPLRVCVPKKPRRSPNLLKETPF